MNLFNVLCPGCGAPYEDVSENNKSKLLHRGLKSSQDKDKVKMPTLDCVAEYDYVLFRPCGHCCPETFGECPFCKLRYPGYVQQLGRPTKNACNCGLAEEASPGDDSTEREKTLMKTKILFLAADPTDATRLRLGQEFREIKESLQKAQLRNAFDLASPQLSVRPRDISQAILDESPRIVHFSGHGTENGDLSFENEIGEAKSVSAEALAALFELVANQVDCVILNACYSAIQASAIAKNIRYVIGMSEAIGDEAAISFTVGFYQALGAGKAIPEAYKYGCVQIRLQGIPEHATPKLIEKEKEQE